MGKSGGATARSVSERRAGGGKPKKPTLSKNGKRVGRPPKEGLHQQSARLQREQGLPREVRPSDVRHDRYGNPELKTTGYTNPNHEIGVASHISAQELAKVYGERQLGVALTNMPHERLRAMASDLSIGAGKTKAETISRIVSRATQGRYSANFPKEARARSTARIAKDTAAKASRTTAKPARKTESPVLLPVAQFPLHTINVARNVDPYFLRAAYGDHQLRAALEQHTMPNLREAAQVAGVRVGRSKATTIDRIIERVQQVPYATLLARYQNPAHHSNRMLDERK